MNILGVITRIPAFFFCQLSTSIAPRPSKFYQDAPAIVFIA